MFPADFLTVAELSPSQVAGLVKSAAAMKAHPAAFARVLAGKSVVCIFEKPSLRTRVSFEVGIWRMGGQPIIYDTKEQRIGVRESVRDVAKNLDRMVHAIVARVFTQSTLTGLAEHANVPIINALSDDHHPCQALADVLTITERFGKVKGIRVCYIGDGNNVARSLSEAVCKLGGHMTVITPKGFAMADSIAAACAADAATTGGSLVMTTDLDAVNGQQVIYTDEWASMHHVDAASRAAKFKPYQVNSALMAQAHLKAIFMHCLPAARGHEVTDEVIDSARSVVYQQAENRIYAQQAVLAALLGSATQASAKLKASTKPAGKSSARRTTPAKRK